MITSRRQFLVGCSTGLAAFAASRISSVALAQPGAASSNRDVIVVVFLRGGMDGLSLIPPIDGEDRGYYEQARPRLQVPASGAGGALRLNDQFGLHPAAAPLHPLFQSGKLAIVQAVGSAGSRSHFDAMRYLEVGTPGNKITSTGWLARHLRSAPSLPAQILIPSVSAGQLPAASLLSSNETITLEDVSTFSLSQYGDPSWARGDQLRSLRRFFAAGDSAVHRAGIQALNSAGLVESYAGATYQPAPGVTYPAQPFGKHLELVARLIKLDVGLRVATVDVFGWDTHENQGATQSTGAFWQLVQLLSEGLSAFYNDLDSSDANAPIRRVTIVVQSEFGRRLRENANQGTDHGTGNPLLILGGNVNGGLYGTWPGLANELLFDGADLAATTDYRQIFSEILIRRLGNPKLGEVFPKYAAYEPIGIVQGPDITPDYTAAVPSAPGDFRVERTSPNSVRLSWTRADRADAYLLDRRPDSDADWVTLATLSAETVFFDDFPPADATQPSYRLTAQNSEGQGPAVTATVAAGLSPLEEWRLTHFGTSENTGVAANDHVFTSDGLTNFTKYALGLDPKVPATEVGDGYVPGKPKMALGPVTASLVYVRPANRPDVSYQVHTSTDLIEWVPIPSVSSGASNGWIRMLATVATPHPIAQFLRLTVRPA
ncbi:MAG: DUF1501 domain-containing protein [Limisphaerales bacterium]